MRYLSVLIFLSFCLKSNSQPGEGKVGAAQFFRQGYTLSFPAIELNGSDVLELRFDVFGTTKEPFIYTVDLCDFDWSPVNLDRDEYTKGYAENTLYAFAKSTNTTVDYVHYRLELPNNDLSFTRSGNYILRIFREDNRETPILIQKFVIYESEAELSAAVDKFESEQLEDKQALTVDIAPKGADFHDLAGNVKLMVLQNNDWSTSRFFDEYSSDSRQHLVFNRTGQIVFPGSNEFRWFDMKTLRFLSERVQSIAYKPPFYNVYLKPDKLQGDRGYFKNADFNGLFYIGNSDSHDDDTLDADYAIVHFQLETGVPYPADIYIEGAITGWQHTDNYMEFNPETGFYTKDLFLKQGLYNYRYVMYENDRKKPDYDITEGNYYQTSNSYLIIIYYRPLGELYYKPAGITQLDSR
jgi:hypothetical protein